MKYRVVKWEHSKDPTRYYAQAGYGLGICTLWIKEAGPFATPEEAFECIEDTREGKRKWKKTIIHEE